MTVILHIARILLGITFVFSGFVKGIDPWGSAYKFVDYFTAMGLEGLSPMAFPLGVLLAFAEFFIGVALLFAVRPKIFTWGSLLFMAFFTPLTLWIALKNPVTDCGCFGDALVLTNWETFYKNLVFIGLAILVFVYRKKLTCFLGQKTGHVLAAISVLLYVAAVVYSIRHEPLFDFRPYKVGVNIPEAMAIPADAPRDVYENTFYYKNRQSGEVKKFTEENYPWQDTLHWEFHSMDEPVLVKKGYTPPIHGFSIESREGDNVYEFFLFDENYVFMLVAYDLEKSSRKHQDKINALASWAMENGSSFICLTSTLFEKCDQFAAETGAPYEFFHADEIELKTIIRSNPGLIVLKNGTIVAKYHHNDIPTPEAFREAFPE
ncbi:MAG: DoxX family protein [Prolixibacteraceae bacterium]|nr:DoxX family protein [Prolixibacteraceae bacterium]